MANRFLWSFVWCFLLATNSFSQRAPEAPGNDVITVTSKDGTRIVSECTGAGPSLVIVHGGTGDRTRWTPLFPLLATHFTVCAMDRRGHGASGDAPNYSLKKEAEDVAAVVDSRPGPVFVLGHSYGGVAALEAAFLTNKITKLVLYEPPLQERDHSAVAARMEKLIRAGDREQALTIFMQEIVMISPAEVAKMKTRPTWPGLRASVGSQIRQLRALSSYRFDPKRMRSLKVPTLLLTGSRTASPQLRQAIRGLSDSLPNRSLKVFAGQEHNAMDTVPNEFAAAVSGFLLGTQASSGHDRVPGHNPSPIKGQRIVIELTIDGFPGVLEYELGLDEGSSFGCGGGATPAVKLSGFRGGMSLVKLRKDDADISFWVTLRYVDGTERKVADGFVLRRGERGSYTFPEGIGIAARFSSVRKR